MLTPLYSLASITGVLAYSHVQCSEQNCVVSTDTVTIYMHSANRKVQKPERSADQNA